MWLLNALNFYISSIYIVYKFYYFSLSYLQVDYNVLKYKKTAYLKSDMQSQKSHYVNLFVLRSISISLYMMQLVNLCPYSCHNLSSLTYYTLCH